MIFKKKNKSKIDQAPFGDQSNIAATRAVLLDIEAVLCNVVALDISRQPWKSHNKNLPDNIEISQDCSAGLGFTQGATATGLRTTLFSSARNTAELIDGIADAVGKHLPILFHLTLHDSFFLQQLIDSGAIVLHANDVQSAVDLALIGHAAAEQALAPCVVLNDVDLLNRVQSFFRPANALLQKFNGDASDFPEASTPAQTLVFGEKRRRVPRYCDLDRPIAVLSQMETGWLAQSNAANFAFSATHHDEILQRCISEFAQLTGRDYSCNSLHSVKKANHLIVAQGAVFRETCRVADHLAKEKKAGFSVLHLNHFSPAVFQELAKTLTTIERITVIEKSANAGSKPGSFTRLIQQQFSAAAGREIGFTTAVDAGGQRKVSFAELAALAGSTATGNTFFIGVNFRQPDLRLPKLEMLQQAVRKDYPAAADLGLKIDMTTVDFINGDEILVLQQSRFDPQISAYFCEAFTGIEQGQMEAGQTWHQGEPAFYFNFLPLKAEPRTGRKLVVCSNVAELEKYIANDGIAAGGALLLRNCATKIDLPEKIAADLKTAGVKVFAASAAPELQTQSALLGAITRIFDLGDKKLNVKIKKQFTATAPAAEAEAFKAGYEVVNSVIIKKIAATDQPGVDEIDAPWTVKNTQDLDGSLFDLEKFWSRIGYLQADGQWKNISADPFAAISTMPAGSSAFTHGARETGKIVQFIPENLPVDRLDFLLAFEAGVWASVQDLATILETAMALKQNEGAVFTQLPRLRDNLARLAYKHLQTEIIENFCYAGELFDSSLVKLIEKMKPNEEQKQQIKEEFALTMAICSKVLLLKNHHFFGRANEQNKGSGRVIVLAINPAEYRNAAPLLAALPELAAEIVAATPEVISLNQQNWTFLQALPAADLADLSCDELPWHSLLNKNVRAAVLPFPDAAKTANVQNALRLLTVAIEKTMQERVAKLQAKIDDLKDKIETRVQGDLSKTSQINDFEAYGRRLSELLAQGKQNINAARLAASRLNDEPDAGKIQELVAIREKLVALQQAYSTENNRFARANAIIAIDSRLDVLQFPYNAFKSPWLQMQPSCSVSSLSGLFAGLMQQMSETFLVLRRAENLLENHHGKLPLSLQWQDFSEEEKSFYPPVVGVFPGLLSAANPADLLPLADGAKPFKCVFLNTEPRLTHGASVIDTVAALNSCFLNNVQVAQSAIGTPKNLLKNAFAAIEFDGAAFLQIEASNKLPGSAATALSQLAVHCRYAPLFSCAVTEKDQILPGLDISENPAPDKKWAAVTWVQQSRDGLKKEITELLTPAHFLVQWPKFQRQFEEFEAAAIDERTMPLPDFLELSAADQNGRIPYIRSIDA